MGGAGKAAIAAALLFAVPAAVQEAPLGWLVGQWCTEPVRGTTTCETWAPMADGVMEGLSQRRKHGVATLAETMRITAEPGRLVFHAEPRGQAPTDFYAVGAQPPMAVVFANPAHDYPQRVRYWRDGELLLAEISLADGARPVRWTYRRLAQ